MCFHVILASFSYHEQSIKARVFLIGAPQSAVDFVCPPHSFFLFYPQDTSKGVIFFLNRKFTVRSRSCLALENFHNKCLTCLLLGFSVKRGSNNGSGCPPIRSQEVEKKEQTQSLCKRLVKDTGRVES